MNVVEFTRESDPLLMEILKEDLEKFKRVHPSEDPTFLKPDDNRVSVEAEN